MVARPFLRLSPQITVRATGSALTTATDLLADAELLFNHGRWARATAVAILALEEVGKCVLLKLIMLAGDDKQLRSLWLAYYNHSPKMLALGFPATVLTLAPDGRQRTPAEYRVEATAHAKWLDEFKQNCLYSDCRGEDAWPVPSQVCTSRDCLTIMGFARTAVKAPLPLSSEGELVLLHHHFRGALMQSPQEWGELWLGFRSDMQKTGYFNPQTDQLALDFLWFYLAMTLDVGAQILQK